MWRWFRGLLARVPAVDQHPTLVVDEAGWLRGPGVTRTPAHPSWYYDSLGTDDGRPSALLWHYTATDYGTADSMARRRTRRRKRDDRAASWHVTVCGDGRLVQMVPFTAGAWHCSKGEIDGVRVNRAAVGIELEGHGGAFGPEQIEAAESLVRALLDAYQISRRNAAHGHRDFDPRRRADPGPVWAGIILPGLLERAYGPPSDV